MNRLPESQLRISSIVLLLATLSFPVACIGVSQKRHEASTGNGATNAKSAAIKQCPHSVEPAVDGDIDDFEDGNNQITKMAGRDGYWFSAHDDFGSTVSYLVDDGGADGSELSLHFSGTTSSVGADLWGSQVGARFSNQTVFYDASKYVGIAFKAKAASKSTRTVRFNLGDVNTHKDANVCDQCWNHFGADISLTGDWREYRVLFSSVQQAPGWGNPRPAAITLEKLVSLEWKIDKGQSFDFLVDNIVFLVCKP